MAEKENNGTQKPRRVISSGEMGKGRTAGAPERRKQDEEAILQAQQQSEQQIRQLRTKMILSLSALSLVLVALVVAFTFINKGMQLLDSIDYVETPGENEVRVLTQDEINQINAQEQDETLSNSDAADIEDAEADIRAFLESESKPIGDSSDVTNILLIGSDAKDYSETTRSDSMIIFSIDRKNKQIKMTSLMRDMYVSIPGYGYNKLNAAYAFGGGELLMDTINQNFKLNLEKYVCVNYDTFVEVVDSLGGLYITLEDEEIPHLNQYVKGGEQNKLEKGGTYLLNGQQVLSYCRIRKVGTDSARTQRQRTALKGLVTKLKTADAATITDMATTTLPNVRTNLDEGEVMSLVLEALDMRTYTMDELRIPVDGSWEELTVNKMWIMKIDNEVNCSAISDFIYGATE